MSIETVHIKPHLERYLAAQDEYDPDDPASLSPIAILAIRAKVDEETIRRMVNGKMPKCSFDTADKIICAMGDATIWYSMGEVVRVSETPTGQNGFEFRSVYWDEKIPEKRRGGYVKEKAGAPKLCAAPGCGEILKPPKPRSTGGVHTLYCSQECAQRASAHRLGKSNRTLKSKRYDQCPNGHDRSPENVRYSKTKKGHLAMYCRLCKSERSAAKRAEGATA